MINLPAQTAVLVRVVGGWLAFRVLFWLRYSSSTIEEPDAPGVDVYLFLAVSTLF